jgi:GTPase SAR1 family protein
MANVRRFFPGGNTSAGFVSYHDNIIDLDRNMLYILKGMPGGGKSSLMREIGENAVKEGYNVEFHHCPSDPNSIDGIVIADLKVGIVDGTAPHIIDPIHPGLIDKIVDLSQFIDSQLLKLYKTELFEAKQINKNAYRRAFNLFRSSRPIYDEIESSNKAKVDFNGVNKLTKNAIERIFSNEPIITNISGIKVRHLFSAAYTPEGFVDYTSTIIDGVKDRYYLKGELGTGKTTFLKRIAEEAIIRNYHIEIMYNPLVPDKVDSLFIKELNTIISTTKETKNYIYTTIDLDEYFDDDGANKEDYNLLNSLVEKGIEGLAGAKEAHFLMESVYKKCIDYNGVNDIKKKLWEEIQEYKG